MKSKSLENLLSNEKNINLKFPTREKIILTRILYERDDKKLLF